MTHTATGRHQNSEESYLYKLMAIWSRNLLQASYLVIYGTLIHQIEMAAFLRPA